MAENDQNGFCLLMPPKLKPLSEQLSFRLPQLKQPTQAPLVDDDRPAPKKRKSNHHQSVPEPSQPSSPSSPSSPSVQFNEELWVDSYTPYLTSSLAVHKRKVEDVRRWLNEALYHDKLYKYRRVLVLSGPAGSGKTATIKTLAREMETEIVEFYTGEGGADSAETLPAQFPAFLSKAAQLPTLSFRPYSSASSTITQVTNTEILSTSIDDISRLRKILLVEDLPNIFTHPPTLSSFQSALIRFLSQIPRSEMRAPLVVIISDALSKSSDDSVQNWRENVTSRTVIPAEVFRNPKCTEIRFNPIAPTLLKSALNNLLDKIYPSRSSSRPSTQVIGQVVSSCNGDIRSAIHSLQFLELRVPGEESKGRGRKKVSKSQAPQNKTQGKSVAIGLHDSMLTLFHVIGKILYSKRWGDNPEEDAKSDAVMPPPSDAMPDYLSHMERKPSKTNINALFGECPVDTEMLIPYLHQNYAYFTEDIDKCSEISDCFSHADSLFNSDDYSNRLTDTEYTFQHIVRSIQRSNPSAVTKQRGGQNFVKGLIWDKQRGMRENESRLWGIKLESLENVAMSSNSGERQEWLMGLLGSRVILTDMLSYLLKIIQNDPTRRSTMPFSAASLDSIDNIASMTEPQRRSPSKRSIPPSQEIAEETEVGQPQLEDFDESIFNVEKDLNTWDNQVQMCPSDDEIEDFED